MLEGIRIIFSFLDYVYSGPIIRVIAVVLFLECFAIFIYVTAGDKIARFYWRVLLYRRETTSISKVKDGQEVVVSGRTTRDGDVIISPIFQRPCLCWSVSVEAQVITHRGMHWSLILQCENMTSLLVEDGSGRALVRARRVAPALGNELLWIVDTKGGVPEHVKAFLDAYNLSLHDLYGRPRTFRFSETILAENENVRVLGVARSLSLAEIQESNSSMSAQLFPMVIEPRPGKKLVISNLPPVGARG